MKAKYLGYPGNPEESPRAVQHLGVNFRRNHWATLPEKIDAKQLAKLQAHPHFEVAEGEGEPMDVEDAEPVADASTPRVSKASIMAELNALGIDYDVKLSGPKLAAILEDAKFAQGD